MYVLSNRMEVDVEGGLLKSRLWPGMSKKTFYDVAAASGEGEIVDYALEEPALRFSLDEDQPPKSWTHYGEPVID